MEKISITDIKREYFGKIDNLDFDLILTHVLKKSREFVLAHPEYVIPKLKMLNLRIKITRRMQAEPLAYILGSKEFFGYPFLVSPATLIPRPETELLVEEALAELKSQNSKVKNIIDIGTGSGNIIVSIAKALENFKVKISKLKFYATDISQEALRVARRNAKKNNVAEKINFLHGNLLEPFLGKNNFEIKNSIITANLPYIESSWKNLLTSSATKGLKYEPSIALYSGHDGLDSYRELAEQLKKISCENVTLLCEIGHLQVPDMKKIFSFAGKITFKKDLAGHWRIAILSLD